MLTLGNTQLTFRHVTDTTQFLVIKYIPYESIED